MKIGTGFCGIINGVRGQFIHTKFLMFLLPLYPLQSFFFISQEGKDARMLDIPLNKRSVFFGFARWWLWALTIASWIFYFFVTDHSFFFFCAGLTFLPLWILTLLGGGPSQEEVGKRELFGTVTGIFILPSMMNEETRVKLEKGLDDQWRKLRKEHKLPKWRHIQEKHVKGASPWLFVASAMAFMESEKDPSDANKARAEQFWQMAFTNAKAIRDAYTTAMQEFKSMEQVTPVVGKTEQARSSEKMLGIEIPKQGKKLSEPPKTIKEIKN